MAGLLTISPDEILPTGGRATTLVLGRRLRASVATSEMENEFDAVLEFRLGPVESPTVKLELVDRASDVDLVTESVNENASDAVLDSDPDDAEPLATSAMVHESPVALDDGDGERTTASETVKESAVERVVAPLLETSTTFEKENESDVVRDRDVADLATASETVKESEVVLESEETRDTESEAANESLVVRPWPRVPDAASEKEMTSPRWPICIGSHSPDATAHARVVRDADTTRVTASARVNESTIERDREAVPRDTESDAEKESATDRPRLVVLGAASEIEKESEIVLASASTRETESETVNESLAVRATPTLTASETENESDAVLLADVAREAESDAVNESEVVRDVAMVLVLASEIVNESDAVREALLPPDDL